MSVMSPILNLAALRALEHAHADLPLMERAGQAAAVLAQTLLTEGGPLLVLAGPGNNGGDAFVAARLLRQKGHTVDLVFLGDSGRLPPDAARAYAAWQAAGGACLSAIPDRDYQLAMDGLFGIGLRRPLEGQAAALVAALNALPCPRLALDCPSGLDSETGRVLGVAVRAEHTITFIALKAGLLTLDGPDHCGRLTVADLGLTPIAEGALIEPECFRAQLHPRRRNSHKGSFGSVAVIGGATGMCGAALLVGRAALHLGAGRVYLGLLDTLAVDVQQPELMLRSPTAALAAASVVAVGPGLGQSSTAAVLIGLTLASHWPLLLDADALNLIAADTALAHRLTTRTAPTLLTPHPAEAARLLHVSVAEVQNDRLAATRELVRRFACPVVLKGCGSIVALPDGHWFIEGGGNPGLATAGSGDVLSGLIAALLAQGWPAAEALLGGVHLHACAADALVAQGAGPIGLCAGELIPTARALLNRWVAETQPPC